jgi:hypothetical protein
MSSEPIRGVHIGAGIDIDDVAQPGAFQFQDMDFKPLSGFDEVPDGTQLRMAFYSPDGRRGGLVVAKNADGATWRWDGNALAPTITPSITVMSHDGEWHGFLTAGEWISC